MSDAAMPVNAQAGEAITLPSLNPLERRILGVLIEKAKTTPDNYPMTLNALVTGCNQKSNREPVMDVSDAEIEEAIPRLKQLGLMQQILGSGRTDKFRHCLYDAWRIDKQQIAIIGELLLRGAQSEGDLRGRASRMEPFADLDAIRPVVKALSERGLVVYLTPEGRRGTMVTHGFHTPDELQLIKARAERFAFDEPPPVAGTSAVSKSSALESRVTQLEQTVQELKEQITSLQALFNKSSNL
ncbi:MAG: YceH family protein [Planctomycetia bacterium]|nr:YceH family protein [Planctomycetia bacterium]